MFKAEDVFADLSRLEERTGGQFVLLHLVEDLAQAEIWQRSVRVAKWNLALVGESAAMVELLERVLVLSCTQVD